MNISPEMSTMRDGAAAEQVNGRTRCVQAPIFVTGFARSGTTWVNTLFREYLDAGFVNEGQFIVSYGLRLHRYGDLGKDGNRTRLLRDLRADAFFSILRRNYSVEIDWERVHATRPTFAAIVLDILAQISEQMEKRRIGSKYPVFGYHLGLLNRLFPDGRWVHVVRDGRDCVLSHRNVRWGHQNVYAVAVHWRDYLQDVWDHAQRMPGRYLELRYEDLLTRPESSMAALEQFVTGTSGPITEHFMAKAEALKVAKAGRWRETMSPHAQAVFEGVAGEALKRAGYPLTGAGRQPRVLMRGLYATHDCLTREAWHWARKAFPAISEYR